MKFTTIALFAIATVMTQLAPFASPVRAAHTSRALPPVPPTSKRPVEDTVQGVKITDDYRWLEGDNSNPDHMGVVTDEVSAWTNAQNAYTRSIFDNLPARARIESQIRPLMQVDNVSAPVMRDDFYFYTKREGAANQPTIYVRQGPSGTPRPLLDPAAVDPTGLTALDGMAPSHDGKLLAFGLYRSGDENTTVYFLNVSTGVWIADQLEGKAYVLGWLPDSSGVFYHRLANVKDPYSGRIMFHVMGQHQRQDKTLFKQYTKEENEKLATTWGPSAIISKNADYMALMYYTSTNSNDLWIIDLKRWFKDGTFEMRTVKTGAPNTFVGAFSADSKAFYLLTDLDAPNKQIFAVDPTNPDQAHWKSLVPENSNAVITDLDSVALGLTVNYQEKAITRIRLFSREGKPLGELKQPGVGTAAISTEPDRNEAFLSYTSFNYPTTIFRIDLAAPSAEPVVWERPNVPVDPSIIDVKQVTYTSKDGTPVTMFLVYKKGIVLNSNNPTIITGYGGFSISQTPGFSAVMFPFFQAGGVLAIANLRGGGEYGKAWHDSGMLEHKQNVFDDMIAGAQWLIDNKYTRPERLGAIGGSNGGLLMGAMITQRPDLFAAVVCSVPLLDMLRYQHFLMARYWVPEFGSAEDPAAMQWLYKYSPYHHIKPGTHYPAVFFTAGENDTRVHALHARKMAAAMQAANTGVPDAKPILLWVDQEGGHGQGKPLNLRLRDAVDVRMFMMWQLGMLDEHATN